MDSAPRDTDFNTHAPASIKLSAF